MPPKVTNKELAKKSTLPIARPPISDSSLAYIPDNALEGYQERIETGIDWTDIEKAVRYRKKLCQGKQIIDVTFSEALHNKINKSILKGFFNKESTVTLQEQWDVLLPLVLWDNEKFANNESKKCFNSVNCITDDYLAIIKKAVHANDRNVLWTELTKVSTLRVTDAEMTIIDDGITNFKNLVTLNLCGNYLKEINATLLPNGLKLLEMQSNNISNIEHFIGQLPNDLMYLGIGRNFITNDSIGGLHRLPRHITVLDLSDNDIYHLEPVLEALVGLGPTLASLYLAGNPCSVCAAYAKTVINKLQNLQWLDSREILSTDRSSENFETHSHDLRSSYFYFSIIRIMSAPQPPKPEKGCVTTFHVELELPLLDSTRRQFLMFRRNESLVEMMPPPEDDVWSRSVASFPINSRYAVGNAEASSPEFDIYARLEPKNSREIRHYTTFESNKVQWNKVMNFQEPAIKIFCPDLVALRDTFRTVVTVRLVYSVTLTAKPGKPDKKSTTVLKMPSEQRVTLATIKCELKNPDWTQQSQHFHWDDSFTSEEAIHWGDGDLSAIQYVQASQKPAGKGKVDTDFGKQMSPENLTCHFGFGIYTIR